MILGSQHVGAILIVLICKFYVLSSVGVLINPLTPSDHYIGRTAPLTSKRSILYVYSTNIGTEYFKHSIYFPFFPFKMQLLS